MERAEATEHFDRDEAALIREQVNRITSSSGFIRSARLQRFLRFVVEASLMPNAPPPKEYLISVSVYDRGRDYDPKEEPVARNEARRLRQKLQQYYETEGRQDRVLIEVPSGGYVPKFEIRSPKLVTLTQPVLVPSAEPAPSLESQNGLSPEQITDAGGAPIGTPRWSPTGEEIAFDTVRDGYS
jgi:hypothetical protein